jgi:hypothetical protein
MTENEKLVRDETEAIECLKSNKPTSGYLMLQESIDVAIKALEEVQKYRAIGTLEELKEAMKYVWLVKKHGTIGKALEECAEYESIGTPEECRAAMEKQKAKKPMHVTNSYFGYQKHKEHVGYCPDCGHQVEEPYGCPNCLRKIDWSDEE